jgi:hypothetical protein
MDAGKPIRRNPYLHRSPEPEKPEVPDPLYIRMPRSPAHCPYTSLARSTLDLLVRPQAMNDWNPPVKSKLMRQTGGKPKIRLINYRSLKEYLESLPDDSQLKRASSQKEAAA